MNKAEEMLDLIKTVDEGYASVRFCPESDDWIESIKEHIADVADYDLMNFDTGHENHCTLIYAPDCPVPEQAKIQELVGSRLHLKNPRFQLFGENGDYLVLGFDSDLLAAYNGRLKASGQVPSELSAEYKPHITLAKGVENLDMDSLPELPQDLYLNIARITAEEISND